MSRPYSLQEQITNPWFREHVLLAFRIDKALRATSAFLMIMQPENSPHSIGHLGKLMPLPIMLESNYCSHGYKDLIAGPSSIAS